MFNKVKLLREKVFIDKVVETKFPGNWFMSRLNVSLRRLSLLTSLNHGHAMICNQVRKFTIFISRRDET